MADEKLNSGQGEQIKLDISGMPPASDLTGEGPPAPEPGDVVVDTSKIDELRLMKRHEISEKQWNRIKTLFPPERKPKGGRPGKSNREMLNAILYWLNTGIPWRDLPERFGSW